MNYNFYRYFWCLFFFLISAITIKAQVKPILLKNKTIYNNNTITTKGTSLSEMYSSAVFGSNLYVWLQFDSMPSLQQKDQLNKNDIILYEYLPVNTFLAQVPTSASLQWLYANGVHRVVMPQAADKIDNKLALNINSTNTSLMQVNITTCAKQFQSILKQHILQLNNAHKLCNAQYASVVTAWVSYNSLLKIAALPVVTYIEPTAPLPVVEDVEAVINHKNNILNTSDNFTNGLKLTGEGVTVEVGDDGRVEYNPDLKNRINNVTTDTSSTAYHSSYVSGVIGGAGNVNPTIVGNAPKVDIVTHTQYTQFGLYPKIYDSANITLYNHSLGETCNGGYTLGARYADSILKAFPKVIHVHSSGNSGATSCGGLASGFKTITGGIKAGKNDIVVGNINKQDSVAVTSSKGPTADGRIKPDIVATGMLIKTLKLDSFATVSGSSISAPAVTGSLALLTQAYLQQNNNQNPDAGLLKAIVLNTADDLGNVGPDFSYGWGKINARRAYNALINKRYWVDSITPNTVKLTTINIPSNVKTAKVMVYWPDEQPAANAAKPLVNNLDAVMNLSTDTVTKFYPWLLYAGDTPTVASCMAPAVKGIDNYNNVEQIQIDNPLQGSYTLKVLGKTIPLAAYQKYYISCEFIYKNELVLTYPNGGESFVPAETQRLRWDGNTTINDSIKILFTTNNGASYQTIANIAGAVNYYDFLVPANTTSAQCKIKLILNNSYTDESDTSFIVLGVPANTQATSICAGGTKISWQPVANAVGYDVFKLGNKFMELAATTNAATTNVTVYNVGSNLNYYAVQAKLANTNANGRRCVAFSHINSATNTCNVPLKLINFTAQQQNQKAVINFTVANSYNMQYYEVEKSVDASFNEVKIVARIMANNITNEKKYTVDDNDFIAANTTVYYRLKMVEANAITYSTVAVLQPNSVYNNSVSIFPNPTKKYVNIKFNKAYKNITVVIKNNLGVAVKQYTTQQVGIGEAKQYKLPELPNGMYILQAFNSLGKEILFTKLLIN